MSKKQESGTAAKLIPHSKTVAEATKTAQQSTDKETEQGFRGIKVDPTPNHHYTVAGVTADLPTPETHVDAAKEAREAGGKGLSPLEAAARENAAITGEK